LSTNYLERGNIEGQGGIYNFEYRRNTLNIFWAIGALLVNNLIIGYTVYLLWKKQYNNAFNMHIVFCDNCDYPHIVPSEIESFEGCPMCHVCEECGKYMLCKTCGKRELVRQDVSSIEFCNGIGCYEKYMMNQKKLNKKSPKKAVIK
jgi:uncharacterized membrane protein YhfC